MFSYEPLLIQLVKHKMSKEELRRAIGAGSTTIAKLSKNENVSMDVLGKICGVLDCRIEDVIEYIPDDSTDSPKP